LVKQGKWKKMAMVKPFEPVCEWHGGKDGDNLQ
jgi:hypothetical protein